MNKFKKIKRSMLPLMLVFSSSITGLSFAIKNDVSTKASKIIFDGHFYNNYNEIFQDLILKNKLKISEDKYYFKNDSPYKSLEKGTYNNDMIAKPDYDATKFAYRTASGLLTHDYNQAKQSMFSYGNSRKVYTDNFGRNYDNISDATNAIKNTIKTSKVYLYKLPIYTENPTTKSISVANNLYYNPLDKKDLAYVKKYIKDNINQIIANQIYGNDEGYKIIFDTSNDALNNNDWTISEYMNLDTNEKINAWKLQNGATWEQDKILSAHYTVNDQYTNDNYKPAGRSKYNYNFEGADYDRRYESTLWMNLKFHLQHPRDVNNMSLGLEFLKDVNTSYIDQIKLRSSKTADFPNVTGDFYYIYKKGSIKDENKNTKPNFLRRLEILNNVKDSNGAYTYFSISNSENDVDRAKFVNTPFSPTDAAGIINLNHDTYLGSQWGTLDSMADNILHINNNRGVKTYLPNSWDEEYGTYDESTFNHDVTELKDNLKTKIKDRIQEMFFNNLYTNKIFRNLTIKNAITKNDTLRNLVNTQVDNVINNSNLNIYFYEGLPKNFVWGWDYAHYHKATWPWEHSYWSRRFIIGDSWSVDWKLKQKLDLDLNTQVVSPFNKNIKTLVDFAKHATPIHTLPFKIKFNDTKIFNGNLSVNRNGQLTVQNINVEPINAASNKIDDSLKNIFQKFGISLNNYSNQKFEKLEQIIRGALKNSTQLISESYIQDTFGVSYDEFYVLLLKVFKNHLSKIENLDKKFQYVYSLMQDISKALDDYENQTYYSFASPIKQLLANIKFMVNKASSKGFIDKLNTILFDKLNSFNDIIYLNNSNLLEKYYILDNWQLMIFSSIEKDQLILKDEATAQKEMNFINITPTQKLLVYNSNGELLNTGNYWGDNFSILKYISKIKSAPVIDKEYVYIKDELTNRYISVKNTLHKVIKIDIIYNDQNYALYFDSYDSMKRYVLQFITNNSIS